MFWRPELFVFTIMMTIRKASDGAADGLLFSSPGFEVTLLHIGQDEHLRLRRDKHTVQIVCQGAPIQSSKSYFVDYNLPAFDPALDGKIKTLKRFERLYRCARLSRTLFPSEPRGRRLCAILQALDGHLAGASYREIALALFGEKRVREDWLHSNRCLFDQTYRLVQRGLYLMRKGYRQFLK